MNVDFNKCDWKHKHASYLFNEMGKFQKCGLLCDITVPGQLQLVQAHRVVLESARSSDGESPKSPMTTDAQDNDLCVSDDVFWVADAYCPGADQKSSSESALAPKSGPTESVEDRLGALDSLRRRNCLCDVTLETQQCKCDAHKVVLAACSDYFRAMFTCPMRENDMEVITLHGVNGWHLKRVLDFVYSGELPMDSWEDAMELLQLGVFYQMPPLIEVCCRHLLLNLTENNACVITQVGYELALRDLIVAGSIKFIHDHFLKFDFPGAQIELLNAIDLADLLRSEKLGNASNSESELSVLKIVLRWLFSNQNLPETTENEIISLIRFPLIPADDIMQACRQIVDERTDVSSADEKVKLSSVFKGHLLQALSYHRNIYEQPLLQSKTTSLRSSDKSWVSVDGVMATSKVQLPTSGRHVCQKKQLQEGPIRDPFHCVVELNGFIYVLGGTRQLCEGYSQVVRRYDPRLDRWIEVASMQEPRADFVAVAYGNHIYAFGGRNRQGVLDTCERYDPKSNSWSYVAKLPEVLYMAAGTAARGQIIITGGFNNYETVGSIFCYDPVSDRWRKIRSRMMRDRGYHVMVEGHDGRLWAIGGIDNPFSGRNVWEVEALELDSMMWTYIGQVLPVKLLLSTLRLNGFVNDSGRICISAVSCPEKYSMMEYDANTRMWMEMKERVPCVPIRLSVSSS